MRCCASYCCACLSERSKVHISFYKIFQKCNVRPLRVKRAWMDVFSMPTECPHTNGAIAIRNHIKFRRKILQLKHELFMEISQQRVWVCLLEFKNFEIPQVCRTPSWFQIILIPRVFVLRSVGMKVHKGSWYWKLHLCCSYRYSTVLFYHPSLWCCVFQLPWTRYSPWHVQPICVISTVWIIHCSHISRYSYFK